MSPGDPGVTLINTATDRPGRTIKVGVGASLIAITPNGRTVYVVSGQPRPDQHDKRPRGQDDKRRKPSRSPSHSRRDGLRVGSASRSPESLVCGVLSSR